MWDLIVSVPDYAYLFSLLHKFSYFIFAHVVKLAKKIECLSMLSVLFISAYLSYISHFALFFASLDILFVCIKFIFCLFFIYLFNNLFI